MKGTLREGSFTGEPKDMLSKARKWASVSLRGPDFGENGWVLLSWGLRIRGIFMRSLRDMQNAL